MTQTELPLHEWTERDTLRTAAGKKLQRWGTMKQAQAMLWGLGWDKVRELLEVGEIKGFKTGTAKNSRMRIDLVSVWEYKHRMESGASIFG